MGVDKRGKSWYIDFYVPETGERKRIRIGTRKLAEKILAKIKAEIVENRYLDIRKKKKVKFKKLADLYLEYAKTNKHSWTKDKTSLRSLWSHFGDEYLYEISPLSIEEYKNIFLRLIKEQLWSPYGFSIVTIWTQRRISAIVGFP